MPAKKLINDEQLLSLIHEGMSKKDAATRLGVSPTAIGKRLKRLLPSSDSILEKYDLSEKEAAFVLAKAQGHTNTRAAMSAYETTSMASAKSLGSSLMQKPEIKQSIEEIMEAEGLTRRHRVKRLRLHVDSTDPMVSLKGIDLANRMDGSYAPEKHEVASINLNIESSDARYRAFIGLCTNIPVRQEIDITDEG